MCEFSGQLIAWLDRELPAEDAADVQRHLELCAECRSCVEAYRQVTTTFDLYCDAYYEAAMASVAGGKRRRRLLRAWEAAALAAAAIAALFLFVARAHVQRLSVRAPELAASTPIVSQPTETTHATQPPRATASRARRSGQATPPLKTGDGDEVSFEPALEIAIPADAILPPGAVPEGVSFDADVTIAPDGSAQQINLTPQLTEFERRSSLP